MTVVQLFMLPPLLHFLWQLAADSCLQCSLSLAAESQMRRVNYKKIASWSLQLLFNRIHIWPLMVDFLKLPLDPQTMKNAGFKALNLKIWVATPKKRRLWIPRMFIFFLLVCELSLKGKKVPQELDSQCLPEPLLAMALCVLPRVVMSRNLCRNHIFFLIYPKDHG